MLLGPRHRAERKISKLSPELPALVNMGQRELEADLRI